MLYRTRKFVAVLLAVWLPIFSGNAMAGSVAMQMMGGSCQMMETQAGEQQLPSASSMHQHTQNVNPAADPNQTAQTVEQQNSSCNNHSVCHFACIGYLATVALEIPNGQPSSLSYLPFSSQFQSVTSIPLVPPPLARV